MFMKSNNGSNSMKTKLGVSTRITFPYWVASFSFLAFIRSFISTSTGGA